jgi:hypothetical protein
MNNKRKRGDDDPPDQGGHAMSTSKPLSTNRNIGCWCSSFNEEMDNG